MKGKSFKRLISLSLSLMLVMTTLVPFNASAATASFTEAPDGYVWNKNYLQQNNIVGTSENFEDENAARGELANVTDALNDADYAVIYNAADTVNPSDIVFDLGKEILIGGAELYYSYRPAAGGSVSLYISEDGQNWGEPYTTFVEDSSITENTDCTTEVTFDAVKTRYVRLAVQNPAQVFKLMEFWLYELKALPELTSEYAWNKNYLKNEGIIGTSEGDAAGGGIWARATDGTAYEVVPEGVTYAFANGAEDGKKANMIFDLGEKKEIGGAMLNYAYRTNGGHVKVYGADTNASDTAWTELGTFDDGITYPDATVLLSEIAFTKIEEYQFIKIEAENNKGYLKLFEFKIYVKDAGVELPELPSGKAWQTGYLQMNAPTIAHNGLNSTDGVPERMVNNIVGNGDYILFKNAEEASNVILDLGKAVNVGGAKLIYNYRTSTGKITISATNAVDESGAPTNWVELNTFGKYEDYESRDDYGTNDAGQIYMLTEEVGFTPAEYRYIRLEAEKANSIFKIFEFYLYAIVDDVTTLPTLESGYSWNYNYLLNNAPTITHNGYAAAGNGDVATKIVDNSEANTSYAMFKNESEEANVILDLGSSVNVGGAKLVYNYREGTGKITISATNDVDAEGNPTNWADLKVFGKYENYPAYEDYGTVTAGQIYMVTEQVGFTPAEYRYIKLEAEKANSIFKIYEFYLYAIEEYQAYGNVHTFSADDDTLVMKFNEEPAAVAFAVPAGTTGSIAFEIDGNYYAKTPLNEATTVYYSKLSGTSFNGMKSVKLICDTESQIDATVEFFKTSDIKDVYTTKLGINNKSVVSGAAQDDTNGNFGNIEAGAYITYKAVDFGDVKNPFTVTAYIGVSDKVMKYSGKPYEILVDGIKVSEGAVANTDDWYTYGENKSDVSVGLSGLHEVSIRFPQAGAGCYEKLTFTSPDKIVNFDNTETKTTFKIAASAEDTLIDSTCKVYIALYDTASGKLLEANVANVVIDGNYITATADVTLAAEGQTVKAFVFGGESGMKPFIDAESISVPVSEQNSEQEEVSSDA